MQKHKFICTQALKRDLSINIIRPTGERTCSDRGEVANIARHLIESFASYGKSDWWTRQQCQGHENFPVAL